VFIVLFHDSTLTDIEQRVDYSFSMQVLRSVALYYRFMAGAMLLFYVLFAISLVMIQDGMETHLFHDGPATLAAALTFTLDLLMRGAFFDVMEHFDLALTRHRMNFELRWFVIYAFVFRMFYGVTLLKIVLSFAWLSRKIALARREWMVGGGSGAGRSDSRGEPN
jgi:hypothetical protein